jgi:hypothetical protein
MTRSAAKWTVLLGIILLWGAGLLLLPRPSAAQVTVTGPATPTTHALSVWFQQHIPARFQARGKVEVQPLSDAGMDDYLHTDSDTQNSDTQNSDTDSDEEVDGVFTDDPPQIFLRVSDPAQIDYATFAHEYGHYVWFDLLSKGDRKKYKAIYDRQKSAHRLISEYAAESLEEGFAEAFSTNIVDPESLLHQDPLSYQFLSRWPKE